MISPPQTVVVGPLTRRTPPFTQTDHTVSVASDIPIAVRHGRPIVNPSSLQKGSGTRGLRVQRMQCGGRACEHRGTEVSETHLRHIPAWLSSLRVKYCLRPCDVPGRFFHSSLRDKTHSKVPEAKAVARKAWQSPVPKFGVAPRNPRHTHLKLLSLQTRAQVLRCF